MLGAKGTAALDIFSFKQKSRCIYIYIDTVSISFGEDDRSVHKHIVYITYLLSSYTYPSLCMERERDSKIDASPDNQNRVAPHLYKPL